MVTIQAQIQVGPSHQARLPPIQDTPVELCESHEDLVWKPDTLSDVDLLMYLRASRSMAAFVGWCDGGSTDDGCAAASMDETTINSLQLLHDNAYNTGRALQALVKVINPKSVDRRWSDDDAKRFVRGLKQHGKNFFKIRRDVLPGKSTAELVEYYYLWKKLSLTSRPPTHKRRRVLRRQPPTPPTPPSSESVEEPTSPSDDTSDNEMESDEAVDYVCSHCRATQSTTWFEVNSKPGTVICASCKSFRRTGDTGELPPYVFRPVKEEGQPAAADRQLDSANSSGDRSSRTTNSDECCTAPVDRTSPRTASSCSSQTGASSSEKVDQSASKCSSPVPNPVKAEHASSFAAAEDSGSALRDDDQPAPPRQTDHGLDLGTVSRDKVNDDWKPVDDRLQNSASLAMAKTESANDGVDYRSMETCVKVKKELKDADEGHGEGTRDVQPIISHLKSEDVAEDGATTQWADVKSTPMNRAVASVAPCPTLMSGSTSPWKSSPGFPVPPLLHHSASVPTAPLDCRTPPTIALSGGGASCHGTPMVYEEGSDESDMEIGKRSPSPEQRPIYEECYNSKNAVFMRRWFRGRNSCSRCDLEFLPAHGSSLATKRDATFKSSRHHSAVKPNQAIISGSSNHLAASSSSSVNKDTRRSEVKREEELRKKTRTPPENRSFDAQITSTLMSMQGMDLPPGLPRGPPGYPPFGQSPTPALQKLSEYIRPHSGAPQDVPRYMPFGGPAPHQQGVDPFKRMAGPLPCMPGAWESADKREREAVFEREMREMEMIDKIRHEMAAQGFDRLLAMGQQNCLDGPAWEELHRVYGSLALGALQQQQQPGLGIPGVFPAELMQRDRERIEMMRSSQEHQQQQLAAAMAAASNRDNAAVAAVMAAAAANNRDVAAAMAAASNRDSASIAAAMAAASNRDNMAAAMAAAGGRDNAAAVKQLFQKYSQDPVMLQRHLLAMSSPKEQELGRMMDASSLVYHFARADPLAGAAGGGNGAQVGPPPGLPPPQPQHFPVAPPQQELMALAQHYERLYMDMLSRPPYNSDPVLAQQLMMQMSAHHDAIRHQLALERDNGMSSQQQQQPSLR